MILSILKLLNGDEIIGEVVSDNTSNYEIKAPFYIKDVETEESRTYSLVPVSKFIVDNTIHINKQQVMILPYEVDNQIISESYLEHIRIYNSINSNTLKAIKHHTDMMKIQSSIKEIIRDNDFLKISLLMMPIESLSVN